MSKNLSSEKNWVTTTERFVVFLDVMGFKDFVARNSHDKVYEMMTKLSKSKEIVDNLIGDEIDDPYKDKELYTTSFSDSIILFSKDNSEQSFEIISNCAAFILEDAFENSIPIKGSIAYGIISVNKEEQIYFGQPLIDAYLLQEEVNYYGIVAHNCVDRYIKGKSLESSVEENYFEIKTPLKSGNIGHRNLRWFNFLDRNGNDVITITKMFYNYINNLKLITSGSPRKYIDNTIEVFKLVYSPKADSTSPPSIK